jgi:hypothetical protein
MIKDVNVYISIPVCVLVCWCVGVFVMRSFTPLSLEIVMLMQECV